jgi:hypothetical protein
MKKMKYKIVHLTATVSALEQQNAALIDENKDLCGETYALSIEMRILKCLCEKKISKIESKSGVSTESDEIKAMVQTILSFN